MNETRTLTTAASASSQQKHERSRYVTAARTHVGKVRTVNEDRILDAGNVGLWAIADGMGGHSRGDQAAETVIRELGAAVLSGLSDRIILSAMQKANHEIFAAAQAHGIICGSTVAGLSIRGDECLIFWTGDSRIYRFRAGSLHRLSRDHSLVQELIDSGVLSEEQARSHPRASVITQALGTGTDIRLEMIVSQNLPGDLYVVCSDGLSDMLTDLEIAQSLGSLDPAAAADMLVARALEEGGRDNISVIIVQCA